MNSLRDLGLSSYEDRAYRALVRLGGGTAAAVVEESGVPTGRIYDTLNGLESRDLVRVQTEREPKQYVPVEPTIAVDRLIEKRTAELEDRIESYKAHRSTILEQLGDIGTLTESFWTAAVGPDEVVTLLLERIEAAEDHVVIVSDVVPVHFDVEHQGTDFLDRLLDAMRREVTVSVLLQDDVFTQMQHSFDDDIIQMTLEKGLFELRITEQIFDTFHLIDGAEVCLEVTDPLNPRRVIAMVDLRNQAFARRIGTGFQEAWETAIPIESI